MRQDTPKPTGPTEKVFTPLGERVLLGHGMKEGVKPPEELEQGVLLEGGIHIIYADAGHGKTMLALWLMKNRIEDGENVLYFDNENGHRVIRERLLDLGVDADAVDRHLHYYAFADLQVNPVGRRKFEAALDETAFALIVYDSLVTFLSAAGLSENESTDFDKWCRCYVDPAKSSGVTTLLLDHPGHDGNRPRGTSRKLQEVDLVWRLIKRKDFDRQTVGEIRLDKKKDRESWMPEFVTFSVGGSPDGIKVERSSGTIEASGAKTIDDLSDKDYRAWVTLEDFGEPGATAGQWRKATGQANSTFYRCRDNLLAVGVVLHVDKRYYAVPSPTPDGSKKSRSDSGKDTRSQALPKHSRQANGSGEKPTTPTTPTTPIRGGSSGSGFETHSVGVGESRSDKRHRDATPNSAQNPAQRTKGIDVVTKSDHLSSSPAEARSAAPSESQAENRMAFVAAADECTGNSNCLCDRCLPL
jgi:hypothetical protein